MVRLRLRLRLRVRPPLWSRNGTSGAGTLAKLKSSSSSSSSFMGKGGSNTFGERVTLRSTGSSSSIDELRGISSNERMRRGGDGPVIPRF